MKTFKLLSSTSICANIGAQIKQCRLAKNFSQQQLADMTQSSLSSVRRVESHGQGNLEFIVRIAQALQTVDEFEGLFVPPSDSIAQIAQREMTSLRQRARSTTARKASPKTS